MSFLKTVSQARAYLQENGRVSVRALQRECDVEGDALEDVVAELCDVLEVARRDGDRLVWMADADGGREERFSPGGDRSPGFTREVDAERRQLTVMFCDLQGSTELAQTIEAEEYRALLANYYDETKRIIDAYEGHVAQYLGDGLLVYFGFPAAHEDDPERAVRASLEILGALTEQNQRLEKRRGVRLSARIGIHTGPVIVGELAGHGGDFAIGDTLNCAARVQGAAAPNTVLMSESTWKRVGGIFVCEDLGLKELKGVTYPIRLFRPIQPAGIRSRFDTVRGKLTDFVGRGQEIGALANAWSHAEAGEGRVVLITGEAGLGKSRLVMMLQDILSQQPHTWLECHASLYTKSTAFHGVVELVTRAMRIGPDQTPKMRRRILLRSARALGIRMKQFVPLMAGLIEGEGPEVDSQALYTPEKGREKIIDALVTWTLALSDVQPVLILIEDLHWQDEASIELLYTLAGRLKEHRVLLLVTTRPEFKPPAAATAGWTMLRLEHLDAAQSRELIRVLSRGRGLSVESVEEIVSRADGVPLYLEELVRTALERESEGIESAVPDLLHDSLMARLDHIPAPKEVAQTASMLGKQFHYEMLRASCDMDEELLMQSLAQLVEAGVLVQLGSPPKASYLFKQTLLRDAAYQSMVGKTRERRHRRIAETMMERMPEVVQNQPEVIAYHFAEGGEMRRAITFWKQAGERARERNALDEALRHLERALDSLTYIFDPRERRQQELDLRLAMGGLLAMMKGHANHETGETFARAEALANESEEAFPRAVAALAIGAHNTAQGFLHVAMEHFDLCIETGRKLSDDMLVIGGLTALGQTKFLLGELREADECLKEALALYDPDRHDFAARGFPEDSGQSALCWGEWISFERGDLAAAHQLSARSLSAGERSNHPVNRCMASCWSAMTAIECGQRKRALDLSIEAERLADRMGYAFYRELARVLQAIVAGLFDGDFDGIQASFEAISAMVESGHQVAVPWMLDRMAAVHIRAGHLSAAESSLRMAEEIATRSCQFFRDAEISRLRGEMFLLEGTRSTEEIEVVFQSALDTARRQNARSIEVRAAISMSRFWLQQNRRSDARELLSGAIDGIGQDYDTPELVTARTILRDLNGGSR